MKRKIFIVDVTVENHYIIRVETTSEDKAIEKAKKLAISGTCEPDDQEIDVSDVYESGDEEWDSY